jgi:hypothetical protein
MNERTARARHGLASGMESGETLPSTSKLEV